LGLGDEAQDGTRAGEGRSCSKNLWRETGWKFVLWRVFGLLRGFEQTSPAKSLLVNRQRVGKGHRAVSDCRLMLGPLALLFLQISPDAVWQQNLAGFQAARISLPFTRKRAK
jgi:hypothetical protein